MSQVNAIRSGNGLLSDESPKVGKNKGSVPASPAKKNNSKKANEKKAKDNQASEVKRKPATVQEAVKNVNFEMNFLKFLAIFFCSKM